MLERVKIIEKITPVTESKERTRNTQYTLSDNFIRFWFKFVYPNGSLVELDEFHLLLKKIKREIDVYVGRCFEDICKQFLIHGKPFVFTKIGRWWYKDKEIDLVVLNEEEKEIYFLNVNGVISNTVKP